MKRSKETKLKGHKKHIWKTKDENKRTNLIDAEIKDLEAKCHEIQPAAIEKFANFPLSKDTLKGLQLAKYVNPTDVQRESIGLALQGHDVLGAAKTGSGKTLAFLVPVLECLYRKKWSSFDGMGALIISPTRELAYQTFEVLRKVGRCHDFSAGLVIGGKHLKEEAERIANTNIVICTPGRLLQHMDETPLFNADHLQILVLDEADKILDLGFKDTINAIIENLPASRQTLLFSATQTKSVKDLSRLSLKDPMYVSVHERSKQTTPTHLEQSYIVCELHQKTDILWSFLKSHLKKKIIIFIQSCKQVRYIHEVFRRLRPGQTVLALHGGMKQMRRMAVYREFCRKNHVCLFATDIAARGLDFPEVDWVIQFDCPEDVTTYIHRVGRTARYNKGGEALLILLHSEEKEMVKLLQEKKIPISGIKVNPKKLYSIQPKVEALCASDVPLKEFAKAAFMSYIRSTYLMKNKKIFDVKKFDFEKYAKSLGLVVTPRIRFLQKANAKQKQSDEQSSLRLLSDSLPESSLSKSKTVEMSGFMDDSDDSDEEVFRVKSKVTYDEESSAASSGGSDGEAEEDLGRTDSDQGKGESSKARRKHLTKAAMAKKVLKKKLTVNKKVLFDEEGQEVVPAYKVAQTKVEDEDVGGIDIQQAKAFLQEEDKVDKELYRQRIKQRHREERLKKKKARKKPEPQEEEEAEAILEGASDEPNLDLLPDPDKIYGHKDTDDESDSGSDREQSRNQSESGSDSDQRGSDSGDEDAGSEEEEEYRIPIKKRRQEKTSDTLEDDEALALSLLHS